MKLAGLISLILSNSLAILNLAFSRENKTEKLDCGGEGEGRCNEFRLVIHVKGCCFSIKKYLEGSCMKTRQIRCHYFKQPRHETKFHHISMVSRVDKEV